MIMKVIEKQFRRPSGLLGSFIANKMLRENCINYDKIIETLEIKPQARLFEIGYGPGYGLNRILTEFDCTITGIDFSELMFNHASKRNAQLIEKGTAVLHCGDFLDSHWEFKDFDLVYCVNVVYFWDDLTIPFTKIKYMLSPGGAFCFYMAVPKSSKKQKVSNECIFHNHDIDEAVEALEKAGFKNIIYYYDDGYYVRAELKQV